MRRTGLALIGMLGTLPMIAIAQTAPAPAPAPAPLKPAAVKPAKPKPAPPPSDDNDDEDIVVTGTRNQPGAVIGDIPPEQQLGPADVRSYGVSSIADLITELTPETTSGRGSGGAPVVLLNGKRISSFSEIKDIPTEAIMRVDILPEEVSLKYGYRADQKVVNIVLRRRFRAVTTELADKLSTDGGGNSPQADLDVLHIRRDNRINIHLTYQESNALTEAQRDITDQPSNFAVGGNVVGKNGGEIDPALSALAGSTVTVAGVPASAASGVPSLGAFAATAGIPNTTDQTPYRTLVPASHDASVNIVYARPIFGNVSATINGRLEVSDSIGTYGLPTIALGVPGGNPFSPFSNTVVVDRALDGYLPLQQSTSTITTHLGTTLNGNIGLKWRWSVTGNYDRVDTETFTDTGVDVTAFQARINAGDPTANPFGSLANAGIGAAAGNRAYSTSNTAGLDALFSGPLFALPAGSVSTSIRVGGQTSDFDSHSVRVTEGPQSGDISRGIVNGQFNLDVPITKAQGFLGAIGSLSLNFNLAEDHLSDFGTLSTIGYGANWAPVEGIRFIASFTDQDQAPTAQQLGNPTITTPGVRVFDYVNGTTATVTTLSGGNPDLIADNNHVMKLGVTIKPWKAKDLTFIASYTTSDTRNPIASFPSATAAIEAAFPDRFTRDADGELTRIDMRPINFARSQSSQLRWGFNFSRPIKSKVQKELEAFRAGKGPNPFEGLSFPGRRPGGDAGAGGGGDGPRGGGDGGPRGGDGARDGGGGFRGGFGGRGGGAGSGRLQFALYHTWHFTDRVLVQNGGPSLDLLKGDAIGSSGGQSRHELDAQAGYSNNGTGLRLSAKYVSGTTVNGGTAATPEALNFSGLATANLRLFADLGQKLNLVKKHPWLRGTRVTFSVENILNSRQRVTDATGATPISYQPDYLDPMGRTVRLSIRKLFF